MGESRRASMRPSLLALALSQFSTIIRVMKLHLDDNTYFHPNVDMLIQFLYDLWKCLCDFIRDKMTQYL